MCEWLVGFHRGRRIRENQVERYRRVKQRKTRCRGTVELYANFHINVYTYSLGFYSTWSLFFDLAVCVSSEFTLGIPTFLIQSIISCSVQDPGCLLCFLLLARWFASVCEPTHKHRPYEQMLRGRNKYNTCMNCRAMKGVRRIWKIEVHRILIQRSNCGCSESSLVKMADILYVYVMKLCIK